MNRWIYFHKKTCILLWFFQGI